MATVMVPSSVKTAGLEVPILTDEHSEPAAITAEDLHKQYLQRVFRFVSRSISNVADAEDVTAEVFTAAFQGLPRFRRECDPFLWLLGIARRKIADHLRKAGRRRETSLAELPESALAAETDSKPSGLDEETARRVRALVFDLKEEQRLALLLKYVEGLTAVEVGIVMKKSPAAVNSLLQRARTSVIERGKDLFDEEQ